ncbi:NitT/TauT family transport system substrate-binding protein [Silvibacterium bohemicum]|uniref:NitT/TauT family transport system substrate-binding protein n=1 Tax=Silvibacterium bohemicum TaxID=1577686 RepID=A0A841JUG3_9BACT|nr:ABC transporter substrate-binding protein [Silvibacterium bohemicum]MBB6145032.1 NitT/TauT family transport system substrate-binding protein [Silvibacterium bohemicum]
MSLKRKIILFGCGWLVLITAMHGYLNVNWPALLNDYQPLAKRKITVAYIPVTCQLTCPVTDYISKYSQNGEIFLPRMFQGFPEIKEALISDKVQAAFIVAPMAIALKAQGVPIKVVYLGHRYGSAVVVRRNGPVKTFTDLRGRTVAIPSRFSDERLLLFRAMKVWGMKPGDIKMVEMAPPDVSGALAAGAIDAFSMGEPFPSQAEMSGFGRVLFQAREYWPDYMSCILVVRQDLIDRRPDEVQTLVDGIARSGLWLDQGKPYREDAADFVGRFYYNQKPALLRWALTKPMDRVVYSPLAPRKRDFDLVRDMMIETGVLDKKIEFNEYTDTRFSDGATSQTAWRYQAGIATAR